MAITTCTHLRNTAQKLAGRLGQERGQSLVEFAVVLPVLVLIILGIVYFGRYEDYNNQETQLAETGARWAAVNWSSTNYTMPSMCSTGTPPPGVTASAWSTSLQCYILGQAQPELQNGSTDVTKAQIYIYQVPTGTSYVTGQPIRVCVSSTVTFPSPLGSPATTMAQTAVMRLEQPSTATTDPYTAANPNAAVLPPASSKCSLS